MNREEVLSELEELRVIAYDNYTNSQQYKFLYICKVCEDAINFIKQVND